MSNKTINSINRLIADERRAQISKWGQQDHPSSQSELDRKRAAKNAEHWKSINDAREQAGTLTWDGILLEEVWEALAEEDLTLRRLELIQVAAVAAAEIEAIDRVLHDSASERDDLSEVPLCPKTGDLCAQGCETACSLVEIEPVEPEGEDEDDDTDPEVA